MFCENCGNKIPDGSTVCPNCGSMVNGGNDMDDLLSELNSALNDLDGTDNEATQPEAEDRDETEVYEPDDSAAEEGALIGGAFAAADLAETEARPAARAASGQKKRPASSSANGKKKTSSGKNTRNTKNSKNSKKKKKKKKKSSGGSGALGVVIGLIIALLLIAAAAAYLLFQMGFFDTIKSSDEELLYNSAAEVSAEPSVAPTVAAAVDIQVTPEPEASVQEPAASAEEEEASSAEESSAAEDESKAADSDVESFELTSDAEVIFYSRGNTAQIEYKVKPEKASSFIEWSSDDESVATVDDFGVISARRGGECTITGTCGDKTIEIAVDCEFTVSETTLDMNYSDVTLSYEGQNLQLEIDSDALTTAEKSEVTWESSDEEVATVDKDGKVTAVADGTAVISAYFGDYTASCIIRCVDVTGNKGVNSTASLYVINHEDVTLTRKGEYFELTITSIDGSKVPSFEWESDDKSVATVDDDGIVTAVSDGTAYITATVDGDDFQCVVRVSID